MELLNVLKTIPAPLLWGLVIILLIFNIWAFTAMGIDKKRAKNHEWRIPELQLFLPVLFGGGIGGTLGMFTFRHKTKHWYFRLGFPFFAFVQIILFCLLLYYVFLA